jgi:hypothetical protein
MLKTRAFLLTTFAVGIPAVPVSLVLWPPQPGGAAPTPLQTALFLGVFAAEALLFGFGVAFAAFGLPLVREAARSAGVRAWPAFLSIIWTLVSWWPHSGFHRATRAGDLGATLRIDYAFHVTLIVAGIVVARFFLGTLRASIAPRLVPAARTAAPGAPVLARRQTGAARRA